MEGTPNQAVRVALSILNIENVWGRMEAGCSMTTPCRHFNLREAVDIQYAQADGLHS